MTGTIEFLVERVNNLHPNWTARQVGKHLRLKTPQIHAAADRLKIKLPKEISGYDTEFAHWMAAAGLRSIKQAAFELDISVGHARNLRRNPVYLNRTRRLAMAAVAKGIAPWSG